MGGLGGRRFEIGKLFGQRERDGLDLDDPPRSTDVHGAPLAALLEPSTRAYSCGPASGQRLPKPQTWTRLLIPLKSLKKIRPPGPIS